MKIDRNQQPELYTDWSEKRDWKIMEQVLWSDPQVNLENWKLSKRGAGIEFGAQVTKNFAEKNNLK